MIGRCFHSGIAGRLFYAFWCIAIWGSTDAGAEEVPIEGDSSLSDGLTSESEIEVDEGCEPKEGPGETPLDTNKPIPLSLIIRGGSSLGAYEAGYLYMLTETIKRNKDMVDIKVVTGASAGSLNSILTVFALGSDPINNPQDSLFYRAWAQLDHRDVMDVDSECKHEGALSSRNTLWELAALLLEEWNKGFRDDFDIVVGASATRLKARKVKFNERISYDRQTEKFTYKVEGRGAAKNIPPRISNQLYVGNRKTQALLPFSEDDDANFNLIMAVAFASIGIPIVFPPQNIPYCVKEVTDALRQEMVDEPPKNCSLCSLGETINEGFVDGGVLDNHPINLAYQLSRIAYPDSVDYRTSEMGNKMRFLYLDPGHLGHLKRRNNTKTITNGDNGNQQVVEKIIGERFNTDIFGILPKFLGSFINTAQTTELGALAEEAPDVRGHVCRTKAYHHPISSGMDGKLGFFDREFLKHDFYLGMFDAKRFIQNDMIERLGLRSRFPKESIVFPGDSVSPESETGWKPYNCMAGMLDGQGESHACDMSDAEVARLEFDDDDASEDRETDRQTCENRKACRYPGVCWPTPPRDNASPPNMKAFRKILQSTIERIYDYCGLIKNIDDDARIEHPLCRLANQQKPPPVVPGVTRAKKWYRCIARKQLEDKGYDKELAKRGFNTEVAKKRMERFCDYHNRDNEGEYQYVLRLLTEHKFQFVDMGLDSHLKAKRARIHMRGVLDYYISRLARHYDEYDGALTLHLAGKAGVNFLDYVPRRHLYYFVLGKGTELAWSAAVGANL